MLSLSMILFLAFAAVVIGCMAFTLRQAAKAPVGMEDENGFHAIAVQTRELLPSDLDAHRDSPVSVMHSGHQIALHR